MLTPRTYTEKLLARQKPNTTEDMNYLLDRTHNMPLDEKHKTGIKKAMDRGNVKSVPFYKQDMPFMLIKLSDVRSTFWL